MWIYKYGLLLLFVLSTGVAAQPSVRTAQLDDKMATTSPTEHFYVLIGMDSQRTFSPGELSSMRLSDRQTYVAQEVVAHAQQSQQQVLNVLRNAEQQGYADDIRSIAVANSISARVTRGVVEAIEVLPGIRRIDYDEPLPPEAFYDDARSYAPVEAPSELRAAQATSAPSMFAVGNPQPEWGVAKINAPTLWDLGIDGTGTLAAVLDIGCDFDHPDLQDHLWDGKGASGQQLWYDADNNGTRAPDGSEDLTMHGWDASSNDNDPTTIGPSHGTRSAGIVLGDGTNGRNTGVAPEATLLCVRNTAGTEASVMAGFDFFWRMEAQWGAEFILPDVITMSASIKFFEFPDYDGWRSLSERMFDLDVAHTNSIGNEGEDQGGSCSSSNLSPVPYNIAAPGNVPPPWLHPDQPTPLNTGGSHVASVNSVGAVGIQDGIASVSSVGPAAWQTTGPGTSFPCIADVRPAYKDYPYPSNPLLKPDVVAPAGDGLVSTGCEDEAPGSQPNCLSGDYSAFGGTSAATPHVAGTVALMKQVNPDLTPAEVSEALQLSAVDLGPLGKDNEYGAGRLDAYGAVKYVLEHFGGTLPQDFTIPAGETWSFEDVTVAFVEDARLIVYGVLNSDGTTFTAADAGNRWGGIRFEPGSDGSLTSTTVELADTYRPTVYVNNATPSFTNVRLRNGLHTGLHVRGSSASVTFQQTGGGESLIEDHERDGIYATSGASVYVYDSEIQANRYGAWANNADIYLHDNDVLLNTQYGAYAQNGGTVHFGVYWGSVSSVNNLLDDNTVGVLRSAGGADLAAGAGIGSTLSQNTFRRAGLEKHAEASYGSDIRAECNFWGTSSGPDLPYVSLDGTSTFDYQPFLSLSGSTCGGGGVGSRQAQGQSLRLATRSDDVGHVSGPPEGMDPLRWEALRLADVGQFDEALQLLVRAVEEARDPADSHRAYEALARLSRRDKAERLTNFLENRTRIEAERPYALLALARAQHVYGDQDEAEESARTLVNEYPGGEHARRGWEALHTLALDNGDRTLASEALSAVQAGWSEDERRAAMEEEHMLVGSTDAAPPAQPRTASTLPTQSRSVAEGTPLGTPHPNPTTGAFTIPLSLERSTDVYVAVYNVLGRRVAVLASGTLQAGTHQLRLSGTSLSAGVYAVQARLGEHAQPHTRRLTIIR